MKRLSKILIAFLLLCCTLSCSTTSHIPEDEVLYTGVERIVRHTSDTVDSDIDEAVNLTLEAPPTNAFFGSAYHQSPLPIGLWAYNALYPKKDTGFRHWLWNRLKSEPKYISTVNPRLRAQAVEAVLKDEGYFDAIVSYDTIYNKEDSLQARLAYNVTYHKQSRLGSISFRQSPSIAVDSLLKRTQSQSLLQPGLRFSASRLEEEKNRIASVMHDSGYFFFSPDYVKYLGDSTYAPNTVSLRIVPDVNGDIKALRPCVIDSVFFHLDFGYGMALQNHDSLDFMSVGYNGKQTVKTKHLYRTLGFQKGALYRSNYADNVKQKLSRLNAFQYTTTEYQVLNPERYQEAMSLDPALDTLHLMLKVHAVNNMPWNGGAEIGVVHKDNQQIGPGVTFTAQRRNLFGGGEVFSSELTGSYEWFIGQRGGQSTMSNSYELGTKLSYTIPRLPFQSLWPINPDNPVLSKYSISADWLRRGGFFEMVKTTAAMEYSFTRGKTHSFTFTPLRLTYMYTLNTTDRFEEIVNNNFALKNSLENQFIPQIQFSWTYDNSLTRQNRSSHHYLRLSLAEAGGLVDLFAGWWGEHKVQGERQLWGQRFSQFVKATAEFRHTYQLTPRQSLVTRILAGAGYAYGNSPEVPYSEQFYIGGPNSLRGFSPRTVGPGDLNLGLLERELKKLGINMGNLRLGCVGDYKFETNFEYRFPLIGSLNGALFADVGNIWLRDNEFSEEEGFGDAIGRTDCNNILRQLAVDVGAGVRYDLGMLVVRFDVGVPLHDPNDDNRSSSYFNCREGFFKHLGYNLAVGYPF